MGRPRLEYPVNLKHPLVVQVSDRDRSAIKARAEAAGLPVSTYLRIVALNGAPPRPQAAISHEAVITLAKLNVDAARLGNLLRMWLADRPGEGAPEDTVIALAGLIRQMTDTLAEVVGRL